MSRNCHIVIFNMNQIAFQKSADKPISLLLNRLSNLSFRHIACLKNSMECYFGSFPLPEGNQVNKSSVVLFFIPELGIKFKAPFDAVNGDHGDYASLLALLEFIDGNQQYFSNNTYQILGNNLKVINQVNGREVTPVEYSDLFKKTKGYREKYGFSLDWISVNTNLVFKSLFD